MLQLLSQLRFRVSRDHYMSVHKENFILSRLHISLSICSILAEAGAVKGIQSCKILCTEEAEQPVLSHDKGNQGQNKSLGKTRKNQLLACGTIALHRALVIS